MIKIIPLAIPVFFALIGIEVLVARWQGRSDYLRFSEAISALSCGIGSRVAGVFTGVGLALAYWWVQQTIGSHELLPWGPYSAVGWIFAALLFDHQYYWWHRHSHRINAMWAAHIVHHHSQDYNLAIALRQAMFTNITSLPYYLPMAVLGIPIEVFGLTAAINTLYQFWIHTRTVGKLGPMEWVFNTPSHHRVHHGINPKYIDKNHAGMFIIWDRMFGTFTQEQEEPVYGTVMPLVSFDPIWANFHYWVYLGKMAARAPRWQDKIAVWFMPPEWTPEGVKEIPEVSAATFQKWDVPLAPGLAVYVFAQFATLGTFGTVWLLWMNGTSGLAWLALLSATILWATWSWGQLFHRRNSGVISELLRHFFLPASVGVLLFGQPSFLPIVLATTIFSVVSIAWVLRQRVKWTAQDDRVVPMAAAMSAVAGK